MILSEVSVFPFQHKAQGSYEPYKEHFLFSVYFKHAVKMSVFPCGRAARYRLFHGRHDVGLAAISMDHGVQSDQRFSKFCTE